MADYYDIARDLEKKADALQLKVDVYKRLLQECEWALDKALFLIYKIPYHKAPQDAALLVSDIEQMVAEIKDAESR